MPPGQGEERVVKRRRDDLDPRDPHTDLIERANRLGGDLGVGHRHRQPIVIEKLDRRCRDRPERDSCVIGSLRVGDANDEPLATDPLFQLSPGSFRDDPAAIDDRDPLRELIARNVIVWTGCARN